MFETLYKKLRGYAGNLKTKLVYWCYINLPIGPKYYVIGTPTHSNIGDSAIVVAEKNFLQNYLENGIPLKELTVNEYQNFHTLISGIFSRNCHFFGMGGKHGKSMVPRRKI